MRYGVIRCVVVGLCAAGVLASPGRADAGFMGTTLSYEYLAPDKFSLPYDSSTFVVTAGVERTGLLSNFDVATFDVSDSVIAVQFYTNAFFGSAAFNGFHLSDTTVNVPAITGVTVNPATNMSGFDATRVNFDADNIFVNLQSLSASKFTVVRLDVTFADAPPSVATPLPPTLLAGLLGLPLLAGVRRLRRA